MNVNEFVKKTRGKGTLFCATYNKLDKQDVVVRAEHLRVHV